MYTLIGVNEGLDVLILFNVCVGIAWDALNAPKVNAQDLQNLI
jgi:hypothetical protein